jgi:hypothetical protein
VVVDNLQSDASTSSSHSKIPGREESLPTLPSPLCRSDSRKPGEFDFVVDKLPTLFLREEIFLSFFLFVLCPRSKRKKHGFCAEVVHCGQPYLILENESKPIFVPFGPKKIIFVSSNLIFCPSFVCLG